MLGIFRKNKLEQNSSTPHATIYTTMSLLAVVILLGLTGAVGDMCLDLGTRDVIKFTDYQTIGVTIQLPKPPQARTAIHKATQCEVSTLEAKQKRNVIVAAALGWVVGYFMNVSPGVTASITSSIEAASRNIVQLARRINDLERARLHDLAYIQTQLRSIDRSLYEMRAALIVTYDTLMMYHWDGEMRSYILNLEEALDGHRIPSLIVDKKTFCTLVDPELADDTICTLLYMSSWTVMYKLDCIAYTVSLVIALPELRSDPVETVTCMILPQITDKGCETRHGSDGLDLVLTYEGSSTTCTDASMCKAHHGSLLCHEKSSVSCLSYGKTTSPDAHCRDQIFSTRYGLVVSVDLPLACLNCDGRAIHCPIIPTNLTGYHFIQWTGGAIITVNTKRYAYCVNSTELQMISELTLAKPNVTFYDPETFSPLILIDPPYLSSTHGAVAMMIVSSIVFLLAVAAFWRYRRHVKTATHWVRQAPNQGLQPPIGSVVELSALNLEQD